jgi:electron transport complex protein RnfA
MPFGLEYLRTLSFIVVIAAIVQLTEMVIQKTSPTAASDAGHLPAADHHQLRRARRAAAQRRQRLTTCCESLLFGFGSAVGFSLALVLFASIRERLEAPTFRSPFRGNAIAMITAGLMALAFMGFAGLDKYQ